MSYPHEQRDIIFEVPQTPQVIKDEGNLSQHFLRRSPSYQCMGGVAILPSLSYSMPIPNQRERSSGEIGTEYNHSMRSTGSTLPGAGRVRNHYLSLSEAVADNSRPNFNPEQLYTKSNPRSTSTLTSREDDSNKLSPNLNGQYADYPPTPSYGINTSETDFLTTPSPSLFPRGLPKTPRLHPFSQSYEAPEWKTLVVHTLFCLIAYPFLLLFVFIARGRTLFLARLVVGVGCGIIGFFLGFSLIRLARRHLEAAGKSSRSFPDVRAPPDPSIYEVSVGNGDPPVKVSR